MTSRLRLRHVLGVIFVTVLGVGFIAFGLTIFFISKISGISIVASAVFIWIGSGFLAMILNYFKIIKIDAEYITIKTYFGLVTKRYRFEDVVAINFHRFTNQFKSYTGLLIRFCDKRQIHIHAHEFKNFSEILKGITDRIDRYEKLENKMWTPKWFLVSGALILAGLVIIKLLRL